MPEWRKNVVSNRHRARFFYVIAGRARDYTVVLRAQVKRGNRDATKFSGNVNRGDRFQPSLQRSGRNQIPEFAQFRSEAERIESAEQISVLNEARDVSGGERPEYCGHQRKQRVGIARESDTEY